MAVPFSLASPEIYQERYRYRSDDRGHFPSTCRLCGPRRPSSRLAAASGAAARGNLESLRTIFARFGYRLIPLDMAAFMAHDQLDVLSEGRPRSR
jgi:hypothetical protein